MSDVPERPDKLMDLTRWNRAGLSRFTYVDGDAATWLEELRLAMLGLVARGAPMEERRPETWRGRFSLDPADWPTAEEHAAFERTLAWTSLARPWPDRPETSRRRNARLLAQYGAARGDYGWETLRAGARASHVLLGHLDALANEGYLRTATQWQNLARLAAMVNHQPAPPSSALTSVGLIVDPTEDGSAAEIPRGLAMKHTPPEGGAPVVFETLERITVHAALSAARATGWDADPSPLASPDLWFDDGKAELAPGALGVLAAASGAGGVDGVLLTGVARDAAAGRAEIALGEAELAWTRGAVVLHVDPKAVRRGLPRSTPGVLVLKLDTASNYPIDSVIRLHYPGDSEQLRVTGTADGHLKLATDNDFSLDHGTPVTVETLVPVTGTSSGDLIVSHELGKVAFFVDTLGAVVETEGDEEPALDADDNEVGILGFRFGEISTALGFLYMPTKGAKREAATVVAAPPAVVPDAPAPQRIVSFAGKPPKGLAIGDLLVRRPAAGGPVQGLRIEGVATGKDAYALQFHAEMPGGSGFEPDAHEFHGPMTRGLRPADHDRNPEPAFEGRKIRLAAPPVAAQVLIRLGRKVLIEDERGILAPVLAAVAEAGAAADALEITLEPAEGLAGFLRGWTVLNLNTVLAGHGETKSPKVLGSGDAERAAQSFAFAQREVSFVPSSVAETGVAPDMDVTVDGTLWSYRDLIDPEADGTESWSSALAEDGSLVIHFRRRLTTGTDNVVVRRFRTGVGPGGWVPARGFAKPMKKHRWVRAITQPFAATGGAAREPVEDIRVNAPARLAANGRAVSLKDFERICRRRSDIWQARAHPITDPGRVETVGLILVPANGGGIGPALDLELRGFIEARALPGIRVALEPYTQVRLVIEATVRVDVEAHDRTQVQAAAQAALIETFSLVRRGLGQPVYIAEVAAALERVEGVETATVQTFAIPDPGAVLRAAKTGGAWSAYFPHPHQVISADPATAVTDMAVKVEAL